MLARYLTPRLLEALTDSPVVLLVGARQTGKSTLVKGLGAHPARYLTLDDAAVLAASRSDPTGFIAGLRGPVVLDEVQRAPDLFLALKAAVDRDRRPGRFLLTGSANVLMLPRLSESLAGRMDILTLWPLSQGEIEGVQSNVLDALFADDGLELPPQNPDPDLFGRLLRGGYPEVLTRTPERRRAWFGAYLTTILQRDVRDLANIEGLTNLPRLLRLLAARTSGLLNYAELSRSAALPQTTLKRYLTLLEATYLITPLPAWSRNLSKRLVKAPKMHLADTGLMAHLLGVNRERLRRDATLSGPLLESFVVTELRKQVGWSQTRPELFHYRTQSGQEVDVVLEDAAGQVVGVEVKASATVTAQDFKGLRALAEALGTSFQRGVVFYTGEASVPFGNELYALPISTLWQAVDAMSSCG